MVEFASNYVPENVEANPGFEPIPAGKYQAVAVDSEMKDTKKGNGQYLQFIFEIIEGEYKGRKIFHRFNMVNENKTAQDIGHSQLKQFAEAAGKPNARDSAELHNTPVFLNVIVRQDQQYGPQNDVKSISDLNSAVAVAVDAPASEDKPAWMNKSS